MVPNFTCLLSHRINDKQKPKSKKRKWLVAMMIVFFMSTAIFTALFVYYYKMPNNASGVEICNTPNCVITASIMTKMMNFTSDPCDDFSEFACGRYYKEVKLKEGVILLGTLENVNTASTETLKVRQKYGLLNVLTPWSYPILSYNKNYAIEQVGVGPILNNTDIINNWPTLNPAWNESDFDFQLTLARYSLLLVNPLFKFGLYSTYGDFSKNKLQASRRFLCNINVPPLDLDYRIFQQAGPQPKALQTYLTELVVALGAEANVSSQDAKDVVDFQRKQAKVYLASAVLSSGGKFNTTTLSKVGEICPNIDVAGMLRSAFGVAGVALPDDLKLILFPGEYLVMLNKLINETSP
ncbi:unnamed protein product, partial [Candidula unifasciata]